MTRHMGVKCFGENSKTNAASSHAVRTVFFVVPNKNLTTMAVQDRRAKSSAVLKVILLDKIYLAGGATFACNSPAPRLIRVVEPYKAAGRGRREGVGFATHSFEGRGGKGGLQSIPRGGGENIPWGGLGGGSGGWGALQNIPRVR